jgi:hypothetical protein
MSQTKSLNRQKLPLILVLLLALPLLLAACGNENTAATNNDFELPTNSNATVYSQLTDNSQFQQDLFKDVKSTFSSRSVAVYTTGMSMNDTQNWYKSEMIKKGWVEKSTELLSTDALGNNGWVLTFIKHDSTQNVDHVVGVVMLAPDAFKTTNSILQNYQGSLPTNNQNLLVVTQATYKAGTGSANPTPTPTK